MSRKKARWLETQGNFGIFPINLEPGKIHVLGDVLSQAPYIMNVAKPVMFIAVKVPFIYFEEVT